MDKKKDTYLRPKRSSQKVVTLKFLLSFSRLNLLSLFSKKQVEVIEKSGLTMTEVVEIFEYGKNNDKY